MKLRYTFEAVDMGDDIILVPVGDGAGEVHGVLRMNKEGQEIIKMLKEETSEKEIIDTLSAKYDNQRDILAEYVDSVLDVLREANVIE